MAGRPRAFDEKDVLDRAMAVFWRNGYAGTGMTELEQATGLGRQSLYGAFGDKRALFEKVLEHYELTVLRPGLLALLEAPGSPRKNLQLMLQSWRKGASAADFTGCLVGNCIAELAVREPALAGLLAPKLAMMETWIRRAVQRAQRAGEIPMSVDAKAVARTLLVMSQGLSVVARVNRDEGFVRHIVASADRLLDGV